MERIETISTIEFSHIFWKHKFYWIPGKTVIIVTVIKSKKPYFLKKLIGILLWLIYSSVFIYFIFFKVEIKKKTSPMICITSEQHFSPFLHFSAPSTVKGLVGQQNIKKLYPGWFNKLGMIFQPRAHFAVRNMEF